MLSLFSIALVLSVALVFLVKPVAVHVGLLDKPNLRKRHDGAVPLIGGVVIYAALLVSVFFFDCWRTPEALGLMVLSFPVMLVGVADDRWGLSPTWRFLVEIPCCLLAVYLFGVRLDMLGGLLPNMSFTLGLMAVPLSVIGMVGVINALNMTDGVDGLAGGLSFLIFCALAVLTYSTNYQTCLQLLSIAACVLGFLIFNSRFFGRSRAAIFLGDGGTLFLGFAISWYLISLSQGPDAVITPVAALWIFAAPLFDTIAVMVRRVRRGQSPFHPDREHLHHIFLLAGFGVNRTVLIIIGIQSLYIAYAFASLYFSIPEWISFWLFLGVFGVYYWSMSHAWRLMKRLKSFREWAGFEDRRMESLHEPAGRRAGLDRRRAQKAFNGEDRRKVQSRRGEVDRRSLPYDVAEK